MASHGNFVNVVYFIINYLNIRQRIRRINFCPKCNFRMTLDLVAHLKADGMPTFFIVNMAMHILSDANCPSNLLKPIAEWMKKYGDKIGELDEEEQDKLALVKWNRWAT